MEVGSRSAELEGVRAGLGFTAETTRAEVPGLAWLSAKTTRTHAIKLMKKNAVFCLENAK